MIQSLPEHTKTDQQLVADQLCCFTASDGYQMQYRHHKPTCGEPLGYVVAVHGIQSHSGWYTDSSNMLCQAGYDVRFLDRRGSGLNDIERGHAPHADRLVNDIIQFIAEVREERNRIAPTSPVIMLGLSWGGKLAAVVAARRPELIDGLVLLYPGIYARVQPGTLARISLRIGHALGYHNRKISIPLEDPALFTQDQERQEFILKDPLALREASVSLLHASLCLENWAQQSAPHIRCPVLMMLAGNDRIVDNFATRRFFDQLPTLEKTLKEYSEAEHTLEFEPMRDQFVADLVQWFHQLREHAL